MWRLLLVVLLLASFAVQAQQLCMPHEEMAKTLKTYHEENQIAIAWVGNDNVIVHYAKTDRSKWTLVIVDTNGRACIILSGEDWVEIEEVKGEPS